MSDWRANPVQPPGGWFVGPTVAGMGSRIGVWLLDWAILGLMGLGVVLAAVVVGSAGENPEATRQLLADPAAEPSVPLLMIRSGELVALAAVWVGLVIVYPAVCWARFRGLPVQRMASLEVADAATGVNLTLRRALARSLVLNGPLAAALAAVVLAAVDIMATRPLADYGRSSDKLSQLLMASDWGLLVSLASLVVWIWPLALLVSAWAGFRHRGVHDMAGRSVVVRSAAAVASWPRVAGPVAGYPGWVGGAPSAPPFPPPTAPPPPGGPMPHPAAPRAGQSWIASEEPEPVAGRLAGGHRVAPLGRRVGAYLLDGLLVFGVYSLVIVAVRGTAAGTDAPVLEKESMLIGLATGAAQFAYFVGTWCAFRGSLGQRVTGLLVVRENGDRVGLLDGVARWAVLQGPLALAIALPTSLLYLGPILAAIWTALLISSVRSDAQGRGYHDRIAGTRVILQA